MVMVVVRFTVVGRPPLVYAALSCLYYKRSVRPLTSTLTTAHVPERLAVHPPSDPLSNCLKTHVCPEGA